MNWMFSNIYINSKEILYYSFWTIMVIIIVLAIIFVNKELNKKNDNK